MIPEVGAQVRVTDGAGVEHICTVRDLLSSQFTAAYEWQRTDGGWKEVVLFAFYRDYRDTWELLPPNRGEAPTGKGT